MSRPGVGVPAQKPPPPSRPLRGFQYSIAFLCLTLFFSGKKRDAEVREEMKNLREAMKDVSDSAKGLARQRDDARVALARAKGTLRRMAPVRCCR